MMTINSMIIPNFIDTELLVNEMYSRIDEYDCITLSKYICKCNDISSEDVTFMFDNGFCLSNETIVKGARELFGEDFYFECVQSIARLN